MSLMQTPVKSSRNGKKLVWTQSKSYTKSFIRLFMCLFIQGNKQLLDFYSVPALILDMGKQ